MHKFVILTLTVKPFLILYIATAQKTINVKEIALC